MPIRFACESGNIEIVHLQIKNSAKNNVQTYDELFPVHFACSSGNIELIRFLLSVWQDINSAGYNNKMCVVFVCENGFDELVIHLLDEQSFVVRILWNYLICYNQMKTSIVTVLTQKVTLHSTFRLQMIGLMQSKHFYHTMLTKRVQTWIAKSRSNLLKTMRL